MRVPRSAATTGAGMPGDDLRAEARARTRFPGTAYTGAYGVTGISANFPPPHAPRSPQGRYWPAGISREKSRAYAGLPKSKPPLRTYIFLIGVPRPPGSSRRAGGHSPVFRLGYLGAASGEKPCPKK